MKKNGADLDGKQNDETEEESVEEVDLKDVLLNKMTSVQLDEYAKNNDIDISEAKNKAEKLAIIKGQIGE